MLYTAEYHPRNPEKNYIVTRNQNVGRIEIFKIFGFIGITERRKRPQRRTEPGIENVVILTEFTTSALRAYGRLFFGDD